MIKLKQRRDDAAHAASQAEAVANKAAKKAEKARREKSARAFAKEEAKKQNDALLEQVNKLKQEKNQLVKRLLTEACDDDDGSIDSDDHRGCGGGKGGGDGSSRGGSGSSGSSGSNGNKKQRPNESNKNPEKGNGAGNIASGRHSRSSSRSSPVNFASGQSCSSSSSTTASASPPPDGRVDAIVKEMGDLKALLVQLVSNQQVAQVYVNMLPQFFLTSICSAEPHLGHCTEFPRGHRAERQRKGTFPRDGEDHVSH